METLKKSFLYDILLPKLEIISSVIAVLGLLAKLSLSLGGDIMLIVGLGTLSFVCALRAFAPDKLNFADEADFLETHPGSLINQLVAPRQYSFFADAFLPKMTWLGGAVVIVGILFKLLNWEGADLQLFVGLICGLMVIVGFIFKLRVSCPAILFSVVGTLILFSNPKSLIYLFHLSSQRPCAS